MDKVWTLFFILSIPDLIKKAKQIYSETKEYDPWDPNHPINLRKSRKQYHQ